MTHTGVCSKNTMMGATCGAGAAYHSGVPNFTFSVSSEVRGALSVVFGFQQYIVAVRLQMGKLLHP